MAKFTAENKIRAVRDYLDGQETKKSVGKPMVSTSKDFNNGSNFMKETVASSLEAAAVFNIPTRTTVVLISVE